MFAKRVGRVARSGGNEGRAMKTLPLLAAGVLAIAVAPAYAGFKTVTIPASDGGGIEFLMPSDNVVCIYVPSAGGTATYTTADGGPELSCDRLAPSYLRFTLESKGKAILIKDPGDQPCCGGDHYLAYGTELRVAPFTCDSTTAGLTCTRDDGHGFFISKAKIKLY
jgi:hypothetical protein